MDMDQEMTQSEMEMEDNELQEILDRENLDLEGFLSKGTTRGVQSLPQKECNQIKQLFLWKTQENGLGKDNSMERQGNHGMKAVKSTPGLAPRNPRKKRGRKKPERAINGMWKAHDKQDRIGDLQTDIFFS